MIGTNLTFFENDERLISIFYTADGQKFDLLDNNSLHSNSLLVLLLFFANRPLFVLLYSQYNTKKIISLRYAKKKNK